MSLRHFFVSLSRAVAIVSPNMSRVLKLDSSSLLTAVAGTTSSTCESGLRFWLVRLEKSSALSFRLVVGWVAFFLDLLLLSLFGLDIWKKGEVQLKFEGNKEQNKFENVIKMRCQAHKHGIVQDATILKSSLQYLK